MMLTTGGALLRLRRTRRVPGWVLASAKVVTTPRRARCGKDTREPSPFQSPKALIPRPSVAASRAKAEMYLLGKTPDPFGTAEPSRQNQGTRTAYCTLCTGVVDAGRASWPSLKGTLGIGE